MVTRTSIKGLLLSTTLIRTIHLTTKPTKSGNPLNSNTSGTLVSLKIRNSDVIQFLRDNRRKEGVQQVGRSKPARSSNNRIMIKLQPSIIISKRPSL